MTKPLLTAAAAFAIACATVAAPVEAQARDGAIAAGVLGGLAAGAIIGGAMASRPAYGPVYVAPPPPPPVYYYEEPAPVYMAPRCFWAQGEPVWNGYRWVGSRVRVCE